MLRANGTLAVAPLVVVAACGSTDPGLSDRVAALRFEQQQRQVELDHIRQEIMAARAEQLRQQCHTFEAQLLSDVAVHKADCLRTRAEFAQCVADNSAHTSKGGMLGCVAGLAAGVITGGAAAPLALAGCGGGLLLGRGTEKACGENPVCTPDDGVLRTTVLLERHLPGWPTCP